MRRYFLGLSLALLLHAAAIPAQLPSGHPLLPVISLASESDPLGAAGAQVEFTAVRRESFSRVTLGAGVSTLGIGVGIGTNLAPKIDARVFGNYLNLTHRYTDNGFIINLNLELPNAGAMVDFYPFQRVPFRISPGFLIVNQNRVRVDVLSEKGNIFTVNDVAWASDDADPVHGTGRLLLKGSGFMLTTGLGHIVSHSRKNFTFPVELGVAFIDKPTVAVQLSGQVCTTQFTQCQPVATYPGFSADLAAQIADWNKTAAPYHVFPIFKAGVAYSFHMRPER